MIDILYSFIDLFLSKYAFRYVGQQEAQGFEHTYLVSLAFRKVLRHSAKKIHLPLF